MENTQLKSILIVDDDETTILLNKVFLENIAPGIEINTAENGEEALDFLRVHLDDPGFDNCLLVLDIEMPIMNGWQFLEVYEKEFSSKQKRKILLAVLSVHSSEETKKRAYEYSSVKECLLKPLSDNQFKMIIDKYFPNFLEEEEA